MLSGKVVLITGGTGAIGAATCRAAARHGADVGFTYLRREGEAEELGDEITRSGRRCLYQRVDGRVGDEVNEAVARVEQDLGRVDVLVNNLGMTQVMPFALIEEEDWDAMLTVNLKSMFLFSRAVARGMIRRRAGVILNLGSIAGQRLLEVPVHYATAKAGVVGFSVSLAKELCRYGVRVNTVSPGLVEGGIGTNVSPRQLEQYNNYCASGRPGTPREVAELVAFLASDRAAYINAQNIVVDGGL